MNFLGRVAVCVIASGVPAVGVGAIYEIEAIDLGARTVWPTTVNNRGGVAGWYGGEVPDRPQHAFYWDESSGFVDIATLANVGESEAWGLSDVGEVTGWFVPEAAPLRTHVFRWRDHETIFIVGRDPDSTCAETPSTFARRPNNTLSFVCLDK